MDNIKEKIYNKVVSLIGNKEEIILTCCFIYEVDYEESNWKGYRVNTLQYGTFEIAKVNGNEEYNLYTDEWEQTDEIWYYFKGDMIDELPEISEGLALNKILPK